MSHAVIKVEGPWSVLSGISFLELGDCLSFTDPSKKFKRAFTSGRWDGVVKLNVGSRFPTGLIDVVIKQLKEGGHTAQVVRPAQPPLNPRELGRNILHGVELWDHQMDIVRAMIQHSNGVIRSRTGSGKTYAIAAYAKFVHSTMNWRTLVVTSRKGLARQNASVFERVFGGDISVGQLGDGEKRDGTVVSATATTLMQFQERVRSVRGIGPQIIPPDPLVQSVLQKADVLILDENHHSSSTSWQDIAMNCPAHHRYGLSGTPMVNSELRDARMIGCAGPIILEVDGDDLINRGLSRRPKIAMVFHQNASGPPVFVKIDRGDAGNSSHYAKVYEKCITINKWHNHSVIRSALWLADMGRKTLIFTRRLDHFRILCKMMDDSGVSYGGVWGGTSTEDRDVVKRRFAQGNIRVIVGNLVFDEGEDLPDVNAIVMAEGIKQVNNALQRIGRGMRQGKDGINDVWVVDFAPRSHPSMAKHALARGEAYEKEGYDLTLVEQWPRIDEPTPDDLLPFK